MPSLSCLTASMHPRPARPTRKKLANPASLARGDRPGEAKSISNIANMERM